MTLAAALLWPLSVLVRLITFFKRTRRNQALTPVPVVVVGNITVGGTGKTPMIVWLANALNAQGFNVGVVSRGYGAQPSKAYPFCVNHDTPAIESGDEPLLIKRLSNALVAVDPKRQQAVDFLLSEYPSIDVIISDDGMQHYNMARDIEILMLDGLRGLGNGQLLPSGPLRESVRRMDDVDFKVMKASDHLACANPYNAHLAKVILSQPLNSLGEPLMPCDVVVCSAIGNFDSFATSIAQQGFTIVKRVQLKDHAVIPEAILKNSSFPILITEKDQVKLPIQDAHVYTVPMTLNLPNTFTDAVITKIRDCHHEKSRHHTRPISKHSTTR